MKKILIGIFLFILQIGLTYSDNFNPGDGFTDSYFIKNNFACDIDITKVKKCYSISNENPVGTSVFNQVGLRGNPLITSTANSDCVEYDPDYIVEAGAKDDGWNITFDTRNTVIGAEISSTFEYEFDIMGGCTDNGSLTTYNLMSNIVGTINGVCGTANGVVTATAPVANLCTAGTATAVTGSGPWAWTCTGLGNGATTASCTAPITQVNSCATPTPSFANIGTTTVGTPTSANQVWTYSAIPGNCTYQCINGYTGTNCTALATSGSAGGSGGDTYRCNDSIVTDNTVKCIGNSKALSFGVICDSVTKVPSANNIEQFKSFSKDINNNNYADFTCANIDKPVCFVYSDVNATSYTGQAWRTSNACKEVSQQCGNGKLEAGEECEAPVDDKGIVGNLPPFCSNTCQLTDFSIIPTSDGNLTTEPNQGEIGFVGMYDMVIGHNENLSDLNNEIYIWNRSDYAFNSSVFNGICLTEANVKNSDGTDNYVNYGDSISDIGTRKCTDITSKFYPGQKIYLRKTLDDIVADKSKVDRPNYEDNNLVVTIRTTKDTSPYSRILNWSDHLTGKFRVRVAKPAVQTTGATSFTKAGVSADSNKIAEEGGINLEGGNNNDLKNNNDVGVGTKSSSSNTTSSDELKTEGEKYKDDSSVIDNSLSSDTDITDLDDLDEKYNGLDNVFIIKDADVTLNDEINLNLAEPTTYIIDGGNLNINGNISANKNIAFVVKNGGDIVVGANVTEIMGTYIVIPDSSGNGEIKGAESSEQLIVRGSLYGDITNLVDNRYKVTENNGELTFGTVVSFGSTVFQKPAPMVTSFINTYLKTSKVAK